MLRETQKKLLAWKQSMCVCAPAERRVKLPHWLEKDGLQIDFIFHPAGR